MSGGKAMDIKDLNQAVEAIEGKLKEATSKYHTELQEYGDVTKKTAAEVKAMAAEHASLIKEMPSMKDRLKTIEQMVADGPKGKQDRPKTMGQEFVESDSFKSFKSGGATKAKIEVKNTITGESATSPQNPNDTIMPAHRLPGIVPGAFRMLNLLDFVQTGNTISNQIEYTRELLWTNDAAEQNEGLQKHESSLTFELITEPVRTIAHFIKASKQILDDAPMLVSYIDRRMSHGVLQRLQNQMINGNGSTPRLAGLSAAGRYTAFTPTSGDTRFDSVNVAKYNIISRDYQPNFVLMNPVDFGKMERTKAGALGTAQGAYAGGDGGAMSYINNGIVPMVWGLPVILSNEVASGKFFVGDSNQFQLFVREGVVVEMFEQDDVNVQKNLLTIRAEMRAAFAVYTPNAINYGDLFMV
jgi:HK97 family phage major capsid protein